MPYRLSDIQKRLVTIVLLTVAIYLLGLLHQYPAIVERYYSNGLYVFICRVLHPVLNIFPFSLGDVLYVLVVAYLLYIVGKLVHLLIKGRFKRSLQLFLGAVMGVQIAIMVFYLFWGSNYFRHSAADRLNLRDTSYTTAALEAVTCIMIDSANATRARIKHADTLQANDVIFDTAVQAVKKLSADETDFRTYDPKVKPALLTPLMNYLGTSGYYNPFTTEAQVNYQMPVFSRPVVACHELAHQTGFGPEDEANFVGFLAGISSQDRLLRYSTYRMALDECMQALRYRDTLASNRLKKHINQTVRADFKTERAYWMAYRNKLTSWSSLFYDDYLKANNQPMGMETYNEMVLLLVAWYTR